MERSVDKGMQASRPRPSMPGWKEAHSLASQALSHAIVGATMATTRDSGADEEAQKAFECLQQRFTVQCSYRDPRTQHFFEI